KVGSNDSGMYSCVPAGSHPASVRVQVHQGKQEAAIHQAGMNETSSSSLSAPFSVLPHILIVFLIIYFPHIFLCLPISSSSMILLTCMMLSRFISLSTSIPQRFSYILNRLVSHSSQLTSTVMP
ncbi:hypothetical protein OTU49_009946, partial [Cherax quadricarinatus]